MDNSLWLLMATALTLGMRHGFDMDHLATIDSISRSICHNRQLSRLVGFLFSLGHGVVVIIISLIIGSGLVKSNTPTWLEAVGSGISILFLFIFGFANLWNVFWNTKTTSRPIRLKTIFIHKLNFQKFNALAIMLIGALFAISFDTFSQVGLFSISASMLSNAYFSAVLGFIFMLGMMISDGLNGLFIAGLIQKANCMSHKVSRILGLSIALFSLSIGMINLANIL